MKKKIGIINLGLSNLGSIFNVIKHCGNQPVLINQYKQIKDFSHIILPGVGSFNEASKIAKKKNLKKNLCDFLENGGNFFGICLGMQLMFENSDEYGLSEGMNFFKGKVTKFKNDKCKVPHVGFNLIEHDDHKIWKNIPKKSKFYFVHSHKVNIDKNSKNFKFISCEYSKPFIAFARKNNTFVSQFHPEKSGYEGIKLIQNFIDL